MIRLTSSAGLDTTARDPNAAARLLADHLAETALSGPVRWTISGPTGRLHVGSISLEPDGAAADDFLADTVDEVRHHLVAETGQDVATGDVEAGS